MLKNCRIREYVHEDHDDVLRLVRQLQAHEASLYDRMLPPDQISGWYIEELQQQCLKHKGQIRVAELDGATVGYATIFTAMKNDAYDEQKFEFAYLGDLAVAKHHRGHGIGKALIDDCEAIARTAGSKWLRIAVLATNSLARDAYARYGFAEHVVELEKPLS